MERPAGCAHVLIYPFVEIEIEVAQRVVVAVIEYLVALDVFMPDLAILGRDALKT